MVVQIMYEEKYLNYLTVKLELWQVYHNHKENMANAGFLVQLSLFGAIISKGIWPPEWVQNVILLPKVATFTVYFMLWFLIHYYTRWQLINKRIGALYYAGLDKALLYLVTNDLDKKDKAISVKDSHTPNLLKDFISKIIYIPNGYVKMDASTKGMPEFISREVSSMFNSKSGANSLEILVTYASIIIMIIVAVKIFLG